MQFFQLKKKSSSISKSAVSVKKILLVSEIWEVKKYRLEKNSFFSKRWIAADKDKFFFYSEATEVSCARFDVEIIEDQCKSFIYDDWKSWGRSCESRLLLRHPVDQPHMHDHSRIHPSSFFLLLLLLLLLLHVFSVVSSIWSFSLIHQKKRHKFETVPVPEIPNFSSPLDLT